MVLELVADVQLLSHVWLFATAWTVVHHQPSLFFTISWSLLKFISIESVILSNHFILCCPLLLLPSIFPSLRVFSKESDSHIRWPKYWSLQLQQQSFQWVFRVISFRIDWFDLFAVQGTLESLLQHRNSKASILQCSAFFMGQLISVQGYWKNRSFDYTDLCWQSDVFSF